MADLLIFALGAAFGYTFPKIIEKVVAAFSKYRG